MEGRVVRIEVEVEYTSLPGDYGDIDSVEATCSRCGHTEEAYGTSEASVKRCLVLLRENCPEGESNFYVGDL